MGCILVLVHFIGCLKGLTLWFVAGQWGLKCNVELWSKREERSKTNSEKLGDGLVSYNFLIVLVQCFICFKFVYIFVLF